MTAVDLNLGDRFAPADRRRAQWLYADLCLRDKEMLIQTEHGRRAGWYVFSHEKYLCSLRYHSRIEQEVDAYEVIDVADSVDATSHEFWSTPSLRYACRANPQFEILHATCRWDASNQRVMASGLYVPFEIMPVDRALLALRRVYLKMLAKNKG